MKPCTCIPNPLYDPDEHTVHNKRMLLNRGCPRHGHLPIPVWQLELEGEHAARRLP